MGTFSVLSHWGHSHPLSGTLQVSPSFACDLMPPLLGKVVTAATGCLCEDGDPGLRAQLQSGDRLPQGGVVFRPLCSVVPQALLAPRASRSALLPELPAHAAYTSRGLRKFEFF